MVVAEIVGGEEKSVPIASSSLRPLDVLLWKLESHCNVLYIC